MVIISYVIMLFGFLLIALGWTIWKKQKLNLIRGYNSRKVKNEDIKGYTEYMGKAYIIMGITMLTMAIFREINNEIYELMGIIVWLIGFILSLTIIIKAQKKYKVGIFN